MLESVSSAPPLPFLVALLLCVVESHQCRGGVGSLSRSRGDCCVAVQKSDGIVLTFAPRCSQKKMMEEELQRQQDDLTEHNKQLAEKEAELLALEGKKADDL